MASPSKRRKKNDGKTAPQPLRNLDYFFKKKPAEPLAATAPTPTGSILSNENSAPTARTDEDFARELQEQWTREDSVAEVNKDTKDNKEQNMVMLSDESALGIGSNGGQRERTKAAEALSVRSKQLASIGDAIKQKETRIPTTSQPSISLEDSIVRGKAIEALPLDQDPLIFDLDLYKSVTVGFPNGRATYALLTRAFLLVNSTRSRIKIVDTLVNLLRVLIRLDPQSLLPAVWLATNSIGPSYETNELGIGSSILMKAIMKVSGITPAALKALNNKHGDPGDVAFDAKVRQRTLLMRKPTPLTISNVYETLLKIASAKGSGSQETKQRHIERMLVDAKGEEIRYLTRTLIQHIRIGAVKTTMLIALSRAFLLSRPPCASFAIEDQAALAQLPKAERQEIFARAEETLKQCFARRPNYNDIVPVLLEGGIEELKEKCGMKLHIPLKPMLGSITRDLTDMLVKLQSRKFACEYKYDGQRAQIHCDEKGKVSIFSRHLELMTDKYPDLVGLVPKIRGEGVNSFIMEGEVVAIDPDTGNLKTFQTLAGRGRKDVLIGSISVDICFFAFDLMLLNGEQLLGRPFRERRELLRSLFTEMPRKFTFVKSLDATSGDQEAILEFFKSALDLKCEGIMVKVLDNVSQPSTGATAVPTDKGKEKENNNKGGRRKALLATYEPDKRLESWLKVKKDYDAGADSLDLVPIAAWHGQGRKAKWWSPILLAVRNPETGSFEAVCKCMSGFTDAFYAEMKERYNEDGINTSRTKKGFYETTTLEPNIWFEPQEVWEIKFGDITLSPTYPAALGLVSDERGLSLRFPRFIRRREDKSIDEASTPEFLASLYEKQMVMDIGGKNMDGVYEGGLGGEE